MADVRWLSTAHSPAGIIAAYFRSSQSTCQFRFDLLDYPLHQDSDFRLSIYTNSPVLSQPAQPDFILYLPAAASPTIQVGLHPPQEQGVLVFRNPALDALVLEVALSEICSTPAFHFQVEVIPAPGDNLLPTPLISSQAAPPSPAYLLLTFWDSFPAATPAQLLRRWEGVHTGPFGQRHGLKILLEAAEKSHIPIFLLDLKQPASLAGLELLGQRKWISRLQQEQILFLPDSAWGSPVAQDFSLEYAQEVSGQYGLSASTVFYSAAQVADPQHSSFFLFSQNPSPVMTLKNKHVFPLPYPPGQPPPDWLNESGSTQGLSSQVILQLLANASQAEEPQVLVLGGSLPASPLGDITIAEPVMAYIAAHPWIHPVTLSDLLTIPAVPWSSPTSANTQPVSSLEREIFQSLQAAPQNEFTRSALEMYLQLTNFSTQNPARELAPAYLPQVNNLLRAAAWASNRTAQQTCDVDLDSDGHPECILSNHQIFLILDPLGGRLEFAAGCLSPSHCIQWLGNTAQFAIGLSDSARWDRTHPFNPDPAVMPGALTSAQEQFIHYEYHLERDSLTFHSPELGITKTFQLNPSSVLVKIHSSGPLSYTIPLILDPSRRNKPGWSDILTSFMRSSHQVTFQEGGKTILDIVVIGSEMELSPLVPSSSWLNQPENPDLAYVDYFFQPLPVTLMQVAPSPEWTIEFHLP